MDILTFLVVPWPEACQGTYFNGLLEVEGQKADGQVEHLHIIALNCNDISECKLLLNKIVYIALNRPMTYRNIMSASLFALLEQALEINKTLPEVTDDLHSMFNKIYETNFPKSNFLYVPMLYNEESWNKFRNDVIAEMKRQQGIS